MIRWRGLSVRVRMLLALSLLGVGCGGGGGGDGARLEGAWGHGENITQECILEFVFDGGGYKESTYCLLGSGEVGVQQVEGTYRQGGGQITFTLLRSSCPEDVRAEVSFNYEISRTQLTLSTPDGAVGLQKRPRPAAIMGTSVNGCFQDDNKFLPSPIRDL